MGSLEAPEDGTPVKIMLDQEGHHRSDIAVLFTSSSLTNSTTNPKVIEHIMKEEFDLAFDQTHPAT